MLSLSRSKAIHIALTSCLLSGAWACDSDDDKVTPGPSGGEVDGGADAGGARGGTEAGAESGAEGGAGAGSSDAGAAGAGGVGGEDYGLVNPNEPLPTPARTTLPPPDSIAAPGEGAPDEGCVGSWVDETRGWVVDEVGQPIEAAKVQLCVRAAESGALTCLMPSDSGPDGAFSVVVPTSTRCMSEVTFRTIIPREKYAPIYCHGKLEEVSEDGVLRVNEPIVLYQTRPPVSLEEREGLAALSFAGDVSLTVNGEALYGASTDDLWGRSLSADAPGLCFLEEGGPQIDQLFTFAPEGDITGETGEMRFPNTLAYEPGTALALYTLGNLDCTVVGEEEGVAEGDWRQVGTATVDASGMWVEASGAEGIPCLSWIGYGPTP